jgi:hypothetical protein
MRLPIRPLQPDIKASNLQFDRHPSHDEQLKNAAGSSRVIQAGYTAEDGA